MKRAYVSIVIPTNKSFTQQWYNWTYAKVVRHFKRDKERALDTAQNVRLRLLSKDFIGRWFFKHLSDELVDRSQAERILGEVSIVYIGSIFPVDIPNGLCTNKACVRRHDQDRGCLRSCANSLWRVSDILEFAKFDHERYYYSPQNHTIDSGKFLRLLGYPETQYTLLQSMYRQGRIKPAEFTEHVCIGGGCLECDHGRSILASRRLSLANNWGDPSVAVAASKLRWNDSQLKPFLRGWHQTNKVKNTPLYIMRTDRKHGIDAGLLKYAEKIIDNEVVNDFKRMSRSNDIHSMVFNNGKSPELSDKDQVSWETDDTTEEGKTRILCDVSSFKKFQETEDIHDLERMVKACELTEEESLVITKIDLEDISIREMSNELGKPIQKIHRIRQSALKKLRAGGAGPDIITAMASKISERYGCSVSDMLSPRVCLGSAIIARAYFFDFLRMSGFSVSEVSLRYGMSEDRVLSAINRASILSSTSDVYSN